MRHLNRVSRPSNNITTLSSSSSSSSPAMPKAKPPPRPKFPYHLPYPRLDLQKHPELYRIGLGEQGVLMVEPYKSHLVPLWRFRTPEIAHTSSRALYDEFKSYLKNGDFVGADMTRKFVQMGVTRSRRYANHKGGRKFRVSVDGTEKVELPKDEEDPVKAESARVFGEVLAWIKEDDRYKQLEREHREKYDAVPLPKEFDDEVDVKEKQIAEKPKRVTLAMLKKRGKEVKQEEESGEDEEGAVKMESDEADEEKTTVKKETSKNHKGTKRTGKNSKEEKKGVKKRVKVKEEDTDF